MMWTNDPVADDARYQAELEEQRRKYPVCDCCGDPIESDYLYVLQGLKFCEVCMDGFREPTDYYMED